MSKYIVLTFSLVITSLFVQADNRSESTNEWPAYEVKRFQKDIELPFKRGTITIKNPYGSVVLKNTTHHSMGITGTVQEIGKNPPVHQYQQKVIDGQVVIEITYAAEDVNAHQAKSSDFPIGRVDLGVFVPVDFKVEIETDAGDIQIKRVDNPVVLKSKSGKIKVSSKSDITAVSQSGEIQALPMDNNWQTGVDLQTVSGKIFATIPVNAEFELDLSTGGKVMSRLNTPGRWTAMDETQWKQVFGKNGFKYQIKSEKGDVYLSPHNKVK